ncbi:ArsR/SmtB family transcription factor [Pseudonocardia sp. C8]|uniref:ArsR/SmtB family transcription factor n=1 Tax=Pseudonocardia sp. C8 TaxID=2762759 RepID=UPI00351C849D
MTRDHLTRTAEILRHLADPTRLHLLRLLVAGPRDVSELTAQVEASRSSVSQHLGRLRLAGLVRAGRDGRRMVYTLTSDHLAALVAEAFQFAAHDLYEIPHHRRC